MDNQKTTVNRSLNEMKNTELLQFLWQGLNSANTKGSFSIDEAFTLRLVYDKLKENIVETSSLDNTLEATTETNINL